MPVWYRGGFGEIEDHVISQSCVELDYGETGWLYIINFSIPDQAFLAGVNVHGEELHVGRAVVDGELIPGMIIAGRQIAIFSNNGNIAIKDDKHILCGTHMKWTRRLPNKMHPAAVIGGRAQNGENLFIGRTTIDNECVIGRIVPSSNLQLFVPSGNKEVSVLNYEVLIHGYPD